MAFSCLASTNTPGTSMEPVYEEIDCEHPLYPISKPKQEGYLKVSKIHTIYYATYGNPQGTPVVILHGGPGWGCDDTLSRFFDPQQWHVIMFDQRAAMRSTPLACMQENTPQHSVADIELLREHLGIDQWMVFGGSWGSTLGLLYGQAHPERCLGFILRGIFLGRKDDHLQLFYGMGKVFPEAYEPFVDFIPESERDDLVKAYHRRIMDPNPDVHMPAARVFMKFDTICATRFPDPKKVDKVLQNDKQVLSVARVFMHYTANGFFFEPNQILSRMSLIAHLPAIIVHGRWDAICLPEMGYTLHRHWQDSVLWIVTDGGHSANDPPVEAALATATDTLLEKFR